MFWRRTRPEHRLRNVALRSIFMAGCLSAFVIFGWGIQIGLVLELILLLVLVVVAMAVPAVLLVALLKLGFRSLKRLQSEDK